METGREPMTSRETAEASLNSDGRRRLQVLREDFSDVTGEPFDAFYCPVLFLDEDVRLCRAHLVSRKFRESHRAWTIQRHDVDGFYGRHFEEPFLAIQEKGKHTPLEVLADPRLHRMMKPKITVDGAAVEHFRPTGAVPEQFSPVIMEGPTRAVQMALKIHPSDVMARETADWVIDVSRDLRLPALVSMLKAAHLTLFHLLGYRYAMSAGGHFLGSSILGGFYQKHSRGEPADVLASAQEYFREFVNMARPMVSAPDGFKSTAEDGRLAVCGAGDPWAILVFLRTADLFHAVLVPVFETPDSVAHFLDFLKAPSDHIAVRFGRYSEEKFEVEPTVHHLSWPQPRWEA